MNQNLHATGRATRHINVIGGNRVTTALSLLFIALVLPGCGETDAGDPLTKAREYMDAGEHSAAVIELKNALQREPSLDSARWLLAKNYLLFGEGLNAEKALARIEERHGDQLEFKTDIARALLLQARFGDVLKEFEADEAATQDPALLALVAMAEVGEHNYERAGELVSEARGAAPENIDVLIASALAAYSNGDAPGAFDLLTRAKALDSKRVDIYIVEGRIAQSMQEFAKAETSFAQASKIPPRRIDVHRGLALALVSQGKAEAAIEELNPLLIRTPDDPASLLMRAQAHLQLGNDEAGRDDLRLLVGKYPNHLPGRFMLARALLADGLTGQAEDLVRTVVERTPTHLDARMLLAEIFVNSGKIDEALELVDGDYEYDESDPRVLEFLGTVYGRAKRNEKSREYLRKAVEAAPQSETVKVKLALAEIAAGDFDAAMQHLEALGREKGSGDALKLLVMMQRDQLDDTITLANDLLTADPNQAWVNFMLGNALLKKSEVDAAKAAYLRAIEIDREFSAAMVSLASIAEYHEEFDVAARWLEQADDIDPDNERILVPLSVSRARAGDAEGAVASLEVLCAQYPEAPLPRFALSQIHLAEQNFQAALSRADEAAKLAPGDARIIANLARIQLAAGRSDAALTALNGPVLGTNNSDEVQFIRAVAYQAAGEIERAREALNKIVAGDGDPAMSVLIAQAHLESRAGEQSAALAAARRIQSIYPEAAEGYMLEGDLLAAEGNLSAAEAAFALALTKGDGINIVVRQLKLLVQAGRRDEAIAFAEEWIEGSTKNPQELYTLAVAYSEAGEKEKAIATYESLADKRPVHPSVLNNLAWLYLESGDTRALDTARRAHELRPESPGIQDTLGWIMLNQGQAALALKHLKSAVDGLPDSPTVHYHLGVALARTGNKPDAKEALEAALKLGEFNEMAKAKRLVDTL